MTEPPLSFLGDLRPAFLAHLADRLSDQICAETELNARRHGVLAPARTHSALLFLALRGPATLAEIARTDDQSHQLLAARLRPLERLGLIERSVDPADGRRKPYRLTADGRADVERVKAVTRLEAAAMTDLFEEMGIDLLALLQVAGERLHRRPLLERIAAAKAKEFNNEA